MRRFLLVFAIFVVALCGAFAYSKSTTSQLFGVIVPRVETSRKVVALTFDDGPTTYACSIRGTTAARQHVPRSPRTSPDSARGDSNS